MRYLLLPNFLYLSFLDSPKNFGELFRSLLLGQTPRPRSNVTSLCLSWFWGSTPQSANTGRYDMVPNRRSCTLQGFVSFLLPSFTFFCVDEDQVVLEGPTRVLKVLDAQSVQEESIVSPDPASRGATLKVNLAMTGIGLCLVDRVPKALAYLTLQSSCCFFCCWTHYSKVWRQNISRPLPWNPLKPSSKIFRSLLLLLFCSLSSSWTTRLEIPLTLW